MKKLVLFLILTNVAMAEYRVYQYFIKNKIPSYLDKESYLQTSTLDPVTFLAYHGGSESIEIDLLRSWMCPGHTGDMVDYCDSPLTQTEDGKVENNSGR